MAENIKAASVYASTEFRIDKKSWNNLDRFEKRINSLKAKMNSFAYAVKKQSKVVNNSIRGSDRANEKSYRKEESLHRKRMALIKKANRAAMKQKGIKARRADNIAVKGMTFQDSISGMGLSTEQANRASRAFERLSTQYRKGEISLKRYNAETRLLTRNLRLQKHQVRSLDDHYKHFRRSLINLTATYSLFAGVGNISQTGKQFEGGRSMFRAVFGTDSPNEMMFLRQEAERLGVSYVDSLRGYAKLSFAMKEAGAEVKDVREIYSSFSEAAVVMGTSQEEVAGIFRAIMQMYSKSTVQAEELRGQLGDRLPGAWAMGARAMGMSSEQFDKAVTMRLIKAKDLAPALAKGMRDAVAGELPRALENLERKEQRLINAFNELKAVIFDSGFSDGLGMLYEGLIDLMEGVKPLAHFLGGVFKTALWVIIAPFKLIGALLHDIRLGILKIMGIDIAEAFGVLGKIFGGAAGILFLNRVWWLLKKIRDLVKYIGQTKIFKTMVEKVKPFLSTAADTTKSGKPSMVAKTSKFIGKAFTGPFAIGSTALSVAEAFRQRSTPTASRNTMMGGWTPLDVNINLNGDAKGMLEVSKEYKSGKAAVENSNPE